MTTSPASQTLHEVVVGRYEALMARRLRVDRAQARMLAHLVVATVSDESCRDLLGLEGCEALTRFAESARYEVARGGQLGWTHYRGLSVELEVSAPILVRRGLRLEDPAPGCLVAWKALFELVTYERPVRWGLSSEAMVCSLARILREAGVLDSADTVAHLLGSRSIPALQGRCEQSGLEWRRVIENPYTGKMETYEPELLAWFERCDRVAGHL